MFRHLNGTLKQLQGHPYLASEKAGPNDMRSTKYFPVARVQDHLGGVFSLAPSGVMILAFLAVETSQKSRMHLG